MSAIPPKADFARSLHDVGYVPIADIACTAAERIRWTRYRLIVRIAPRDTVTKCQHVDVWRRALSQIQISSSPSWSTLISALGFHRVLQRCTERQFCVLWTCRRGSSRHDARRLSELLSSANARYANDNRMLHRLKPLGFCSDRFYYDNGRSPPNFDL